MLLLSDCAALVSCFPTESICCDAVLSMPASVTPPWIAVSRTPESLGLFSTVEKLSKNVVSCELIDVFCGSSNASWTLVSQVCCAV